MNMPAASAVRGTSVPCSGNLPFLVAFPLSICLQVVFNCNGLAGLIMKCIDCIPAVLDLCQTSRAGSFVRLGSVKRTVCLQAFHRIFSQNISCMYINFAEEQTL